MTAAVAAVVPERPGRQWRLGRHVEHDPRSLGYPAFAAGAPVPPPADVSWTRRSPILDQGQLGSCTGNAAAGWLACDRHGATGRGDVDETLAVSIYSAASRLDTLPGTYPPTDTGSTGLAAAKAMRRLGLAAGSYRHAFGLAATLGALTVGPVLLGIAWHADMDHPDPAGLVHATGPVRGGHEVLVRRCDTARRLVGLDNSWSAGWGDAGSFSLSWDDLDLLLHEQGDVTVPG